jgi:hypothetical protein
LGTALFVPSTEGDVWQSVASSGRVFEGSLEILERTKALVDRAAFLDFYPVLT